ncbi:glutamine amidotransferase [Pseudobutyrivibrio sp. ACV-2]|uniref:imidazole glycerol phosphate synthase subunit HisH n=1 Tax=Pseudobutyrivibrio sp. ACV-2 TaxID=1520801 RepID=UPI00089B16BB|nr:imidazole glycerol phosphate synthase subunit HisH [Pseudobutyrivibrio sp. ACV-2]SEA52129.1 glutamine amidotransferase [Pseudobutyrivibrio sp. ACV-2]
MKKIPMQIVAVTGVGIRKTMVAIINYGLGNLGSIANMLKVIGEKSVITSDPEKIKNADRIILPGVGAFDAGMSKLNEGGLVDLIKEEAKNGKPILGICLGMQLLGNASEEGELPGLGLIDFECKKFNIPAEMNLKVPHMGWDIVEFKKDVPLLRGIEGRQRYYFVHTYHAVCKNPEDVMMTCDYGYEFACAVNKGNVYGVQFHPEKSHDFGMRLLENFVK